MDSDGIVFAAAQKIAAGIGEYLCVGPARLDCRYTAPATTAIARRKSETALSIGEHSNAGGADHVDRCVLRDHFRDAADAITRR